MHIARSKSQVFKDILLILPGVILVKLVQWIRGLLACVFWEAQDSAR